MKIIPILTGFILLGLFSRSQNFFYIENKNVTEKSIREELMKAYQYVTISPLASDYIITASASVQSGTKILNLEMTMKDSISYKTLFQTSENYTLNPVNANTRVFVRMTVAGFIEKNIGQLIVCAQDEHFSTHVRFLKARKDKI